VHEPTGPRSVPFVALKKKLTVSQQKFDTETPIVDPPEPEGSCPGGAELAVTTTVGAWATASGGAKSITNATIAHKTIPDACVRCRHA
jgi:hypothetical protein